MADVHLNDEGRRQAQQLAARLAGERLDLVAASPLARAQETAAPIAERCGLPLATAPAMTEVDLGEWTGCTFDTLEADPRWRRWNCARGSARAPGGESIREVLDRALAYLDALSARLPDGRVAIVSHCDVIRPVVQHHLGLNLDAYDRIEVSPGSVSALAVGAWGARILSLNEVPA